MMNKALMHFWTWFLDHKLKLKTLRTLTLKDQKHYTFWLDWHLHFYAPGLDYVLIFPKRENDKAQLIITANGNPDYFQKADDIIKVAPQIRDWKFTAFVQPRHHYEDLEAGRDTPYIFQDIMLKTSELKFIPLESDGEKKIDMIVYLKNFTIYSQNKNLIQLIFIMMQDLLGEKALHENINFVELAQMPGEKNNDLINLYELQFYLDKLNSQISGSST